jgi:hypothetical protein
MNLDQLNKTISDFNDSQEKIREQQILFHEKISQNSIALFSLSVPFVGFLASGNSKITIDFAKTFFYLPLHYYLFFGWGFLILSFVVGIIFRKKSYEYSHNYAHKIALSRLPKESHEVDCEVEGFKIIKFLNFCNSKIFTTGVLLILIFVIGSVSQLIKI